MKATIILLLNILILTASCAKTNVENKNDTMNKHDIILAVEKNNKEVLIQQLKNGVNVNTTDDQGRSLLLMATINKNIELAKVLVDYKADVNQQADNKDSAFLYAGATGQTELIKLFLTHGAKFDVFNRYNGTALIPACERGHVSTVQLLANTRNFPINHINRLGWTALMEAVILGDGSSKYQQIVQILKDSGAQMDIPDFQGNTPLQHAQNKGFIEIINIIKS